MRIANGERLSQRFLPFWVSLAGALALAGASFAKTYDSTPKNSSGNGLYTDRTVSSLLDSLPGHKLITVVDDLRTTDVPTINETVDKAKAVGYNSFELITTWIPTQAESWNDNPKLELAIDKIISDGMVPILAFYFPNRAPTTLLDQKNFTNTLANIEKYFGDRLNLYIVGNEPNSGAFYRPQYGYKNQSLAPRTYEGTLARAYDELTKDSPDNIVACGALADRGNDNPKAKVPSHSPEAFIDGWAKEYRRSGRQAPMCQLLAYHPYPITSAESVLTKHPTGKMIGLADYDRLRSIWHRDFAGTAQKDIPIFESEVAFDAKIPPTMSKNYTGQQSEKNPPIPEPMVAQQNCSVLKITFGESSIVGAAFFKVKDEVSLAGWQSGDYYADGTPKPILEVTQQDIAAAKNYDPIVC